MTSSTSSDREREGGYFIFWLVPLFFIEMSWGGLCELVGCLFDCC